ncbi:MAG: hypothetical protein ACXIT4_11035 [Erythrobacter sp.]
MSDRPSLPLIWAGRCHTRTPSVNIEDRLTTRGTLNALMQAFEQQLREAGYLAMGGKVVDPALMPAPKQRGHRRREGRHQGEQVSQTDLARQAE